MNCLDDEVVSRVLEAFAADAGPSKRVPLPQLSMLLGEANAFLRSSGPSSTRKPFFSRLGLCSLPLLTPCVNHGPLYRGGKST